MPGMNPRMPTSRNVTPTTIAASCTGLRSLISPPSVGCPALLPGGGIPNSARHALRLRRQRGAAPAARPPVEKDGCDEDGDDRRERLRRVLPRVDREEREHHGRDPD